VIEKLRRGIYGSPANVALLIGLPAFHDAHSLAHSSSAETVAAAIRGVRLAFPAGTPTNRKIGVALYVDLAAYLRQQWCE
jgi:hypothetical protein